MTKVIKGMLLEYGLSLPPLVLVFAFNPETLSRNRSISVQTGDLPANRGGYSFFGPHQTARAAQGVSMQPETFTLRILLDATDQMNEGDVIASTVGIQPQIDTLRSMVEPKIQGPAGLQLLASLAGGGRRALSHREHASVLLFYWGHYILPVFLTSVTIDEKAHLPSLIPYRAEVNLSMQVIESSNLFYDVEKMRQLLSSGINVGQSISQAVN